MIPAMFTTTTLPQPYRVSAVLPGPTRKRLPRWYSYRLRYRNPDAGAPGCVMVWEVLGGREAYQIALERDRRGRLRTHCTCADAIYRGEEKADPQCKHVRGLLALGQPEPEPAGPLGFEAFVGGWM